MSQGKLRALSVDTIRLLDRVTIEVLGIPGLILMENAGQGSTTVLLEQLGSDPWSEPVLVLAGQGNNGGDGFVIARQLWNHGVNVEVLFFGSETKFPPQSDAAVNLRCARATGVSVHEVRGVSAEVIEAVGKAGCFVDALFGTGLRRPLASPYPELFERVRSTGKPVLAVDVPSGLNADTGEIMGAVLPAKVTTTFAAAKRGFFRAEGSNCAGRLVVVPISIPRSLIEQALQNEEGFCSWARSKLSEAAEG